MRNLKINELRFEIEKTIEIPELKKHKFKKPGLLSKLMIKKESGQTVWWSKNCEIFCFDDFNLFPNLDTSSGANMMYGTSSYLFFEENLIKKVTFQLVGNAIAAKWITEKFTESASNLFGEPQAESNRLLWEDNQQYIVAENILNSLHAHFHWILK